MGETARHGAGPPHPRWFTTTHWSLVVNSGSDDSEQASRALGELCRIYWRPVNTFVTRWGYASADADDLTQQFFARFLARESYRNARQERGRFRSFLLTAVKHFLMNERERAATQKRGGGWKPVSLDDSAAHESGEVGEPADARTAEMIYEENWAITLLARSRQRLADHYAREGRAEWFAQLEQFLPGEDDTLTYAEVADRLGVPEGTIKSDVHRLKRRYRDFVREEVSHTVASPEEIDAEIRHLVAVVGRRSA